MSYDIALLPRAPGQDLAAVIADLGLDEERPLDPALVEAWPQLERNARRIVRGIRTTVIEPDRRELACDRTGITVCAEHYVTVSIPFWYDGPEREQMLATLLELAEQLARDTGLAGHDLQVKRWLADGVSPAEAAAAYQAGRDSHPDRSAGGDSERLGHGIIRFVSWNLRRRQRRR